ncbi:MAG: SMP-30/gluconolactonase/LRE family protein [Burkholderiaceae bacterium]|nr:SMP-30/gluconolactonase/LRE family protein [Burkholderiaceae bacterium]
MASAAQVRLAFAPAMQVGECPLWDARQAVLYWVDNVACAVHRLDPASGAHRFWPMPSEPGCIARDTTGNLIVALRTGFARLNLADGSLTQLAPAPYDVRSARFNDGRCDAAGRFWVGSMYEPRDAPRAAMYCLERGTLRRHWSDITVSNGLAFSPDQRTLYHADTSAHLIRRYAFDPASGQASAPRVLRQFSSLRDGDYGGRPDGAAVDSEGAYWCAMYEGGCLLRLSPAGEVLLRIALPLRCPTMLAFGGDDLRTLYITSASARRPAEELAAYPLSGCLLSVRVAVAGLAEHAYVD